MESVEGHAPIIFVVDPDAATIRFVRTLCRPVGYEVETFATASALLQRLEMAGEGCVVSEFFLPDMSGLALLEAVRTHRLAPFVIFLSALRDVDAAVEALKHGASDYLTKPATGRALLDAIHRALRLHHAVRRREMNRADYRARRAHLTAREAQVVAWIVRGQANRTIARELGISSRTVETHRSRIMRKLQTESVIDLVRREDDASRADPRCPYCHGPL